MSVAAPVQTKHCIAYLRLSGTMAVLRRPYTNVMSLGLIFTFAVSMIAPVRR